MHPSLRSTLLAVLLTLGGAHLGAQELTLLYGNLHAAEGSTYNYQVDYRQYFIRYAAGSVAYINEGHIPGHHRDGTAFQLWGRLPLVHDRYALSAGIGGYYYYDTQPLPGGDTANVHGTAPILSASATAYLGGRWYLRANINRITPSNQFQSTALTVGAGYWFGQEMKPTKGKMGDAPDEYKYVTDPELTVFYGQSIVNTLFSESSDAAALEYRHGLWPHIDGTVSAIYEGNPKIVRRNGIALQLWAVNTFFDDRVSVGAGLGPYIYIDRKHPAPRDQRNPASIAPLVSFTVARRIADSWVVRFVFNRVTTNYNRDADNMFIGLGYRWGAR